MKITLLAILAVTIIAGTVWASPPSKIGFRAYSSASQIECGVFGMGEQLRRANSGKDPIQGFAPDPLYSRTLTLGTKGFKNYSTQFGTRNLTAVSWTCRVVGASTAVRVKVFMNGVETYFLTTDTMTWFVGY